MVRRAWWQGCTVLALVGGGSVVASGQGSEGRNAARHLDKPTIVMLSLDGFRHDYFERFPAPNFARLLARGTRADGLVPVFPSKTFPNHYTLVTGLTAEHHGLVANGFWDPARAARYGMSDTLTVRDGGWYRGEPVWVAAERQGMVSMSYFWPGSEADIGGVRPTRAKAYDGSVPNEARVDSVLAWLALPAERRPHLVTMYFSTTDELGHRHGPSGDSTGVAVREVDRALGRLLDGLERADVGPGGVELLVVSDHGMTAVRPEQYVALDTVITLDGVRIADTGPNANLHVDGGRVRALALRDSINRRVRHGRAYLRDEVPERLRYRADPRIGDLVVVMDLPWQVGRLDRGPKMPGGAHGWDPANRDMHGVFVSWRPDGEARRAAPVENVDVASYITDRLGLRPAPTTDGVRGRLAAQLRDAYRASPPARAEDVRDLDALVTALYDVISGPAGQRRDWDRLRSLFLPGARMIPTGRLADGSSRARVWDVETYIATAGVGLERNGFFEREIGRTTERFGDVAHLFSAYDSRRTREDPAPFARGVNSIQCWWDGSRWWIAGIFWGGERPDLPIPERYLRRTP